MTRGENDWIQRSKLERAPRGERSRGDAARPSGRHRARAEPEHGASAGHRESRRGSPQRDPHAARLDAFELVGRELYLHLGNGAGRTKLTADYLERTLGVRGTQRNWNTVVKLLGLARERYRGHFDVVIKDLHESDDLRILDYNGERAFRLFRLAELGRPVLHEPG